MNIENLSDTELNRAMIWLYPHLNDFIWVDEGDLLWVGPKSLTNPHWSYLLNWNLTMPLAIENHVEYKFICHGDCRAMCQGYEMVSINPLRAICLVLVQIALTKA